MSERIILRDALDKIQRGLSVAKLGLARDGVQHAKIVQIEQIAADALAAPALLAAPTILEDAIAFIESLTAVPLLMGDDIEMRLEDVQAQAEVEAASLRKRMTTAPTPATPPVSVESEEAAKIVYDAMVWAREQQPGIPVPKWIDGGNSDAQYEARRVVRKIAELAPNPSPAAKSGEAEAMREAVRLTVQDASWHLRKYRPHCLAALEAALATPSPQGGLS